MLTRIMFAIARIMVDIARIMVDIARIMFAITTAVSCVDSCKLCWQVDMYYITAWTYRYMYLVIFIRYM